MHASRDIAAPAQRVYDIIADYRVGHPAILPPRWFDRMEVEQGGRGAGTIVRFRMRALGIERWPRGFVTEPEPGRVLVERYPDDDTVTTFTVDPDPANGGSRVTFETEGPARDGLAGALERWMTVALLRRIYREELARLAEYAAGRGVPKGSAAV